MALPYLGILLAISSQIAIIFIVHAAAYNVETSFFCISYTFPKLDT
jgi:hypothetical protein